MRRRVSALKILVCSFAFAAAVTTRAQVPDELDPEISETPEPQSQSSPTPAPIPTPPPIKPRSLAPTRPPTRPARGISPYTQALRFAPEDNGLSIDNPQIKWNMLNTDSMDLGGLKLEASMINVAFDQVPRDKATAHFDDRNDKYVTTFSFSWPETLTKTGQISIETLEGETLWKKDITDADRDAWRKAVSEAFTKEMRKKHENNAWGVADIAKEEFEFLYKGGRFRACIGISAAVEKLKICSRPFQTRSKGEAIRMFTSKKKSPREAGLTLGGKKLAKDGIINYKAGKLIVLKMTFSDLSFIEIGSHPADPQLLDAIESSNGREIILTGIGAQPVGAKVRVLRQPPNHFWAPTGIAQERIWQVALPRESPTLTVLGSFNLPFSLLFSFDRLPREADRVFIRRTRSSGTYSAQPVIEGYTPQEAKISSGESMAKNTSATKFAWKFAAPTKDSENRARLLVQTADSPKPWVAHHRMWRAYPYEVSGRLTGILSADLVFIMLGEVSSQMWFESLGFTENDILSKQRWGIAAKYFKSLTSIESSTGVKVEDYQSLYVDLKYNVLPGIWNRDEIVGTILGFQKTTLAGYDITLGGVGAYWARTMPRIFNDLFNYLPFMNYPKYVDMEFIFYPLNLAATSTTGSSYTLNFHGKVFWSRRIYGEAGFGLRRSLIEGPSVLVPGRTATLDFYAAYGTMGLGILF